MTSDDIKELWKHFVDASFEAGKDGDKKDENGEPEQAAYSLYRAFYKDHKEYSRLNSDLIRAYFDEENANLSFTEEEDLDDKIREEFGEGASNCIEARPRINEAQKKAIKNGLVQPVTLVQGPPGTGKTDMILNFLAVITKLSPKSTVAVVSCNSEALSNITDELAERKEQAIKNNTPDDVMAKVCDRCAILGRKKKREKWLCEVLDNDLSYIENMGRCSFYPHLLKRYPIFTSTIHSLPNIFSKEVLFDYVIIDECSQVSVSLGLIAMAYAKHLMLVGDNLQLQAIIPQEALKRAHKLSKGNDKDKQKYFEEDGKSFLKACETLFPDAPNLLLNEHYRCHRSIADFCNEYVYSDKLTVKTKTPKEEMDDCRIDITWYDGKYMENLHKNGRILTDQCKDEYKESGPLSKPDDKTPSQRCNFRQIRIFMEEKLPLLKETLKNLKSETDKDKLLYKEMPSVCVLAPFCVQLEVLRDELNKDKELKKLLKDELIEIDGDPNDDSDEKKLKKDNENDLQSLSIHKSQGRGYDIVYLMTVEDDYSVNPIPWGQKMRIINVAVSRAKKELHIITSRIWIPQYIQKELPEFEKVSPLPYCIKKDLGETPNAEDEETFYHNWTEENKKKEYVSKENFYIGRLCQWVYEDWYKKPNTEKLRNNYGRFGFHKTENADSIFDQFYGNSIMNHPKILKDALEKDIPKEISVVSASLKDTDTLAQDLLKEFTEDVENFIRSSKDDSDESNKAIERQQQSLQNFEKNLASEDFLFICEDNNIRTIVHILDQSYRDACNWKYDFQTKLEEYQKIIKIPYVQIPTDGSRCNEDGSICNEIEKVLDVYRSCDKNIIVQYKRNPFKDILNSITDDCIKRVNAYINDKSLTDDIKTKLKVLETDYRHPQEVDYNYLSRSLERQSMYFGQYGTAYAFEYALMYDIVFRSAVTSKQTEQADLSFNILSLGCGSCLDAFSAAYSKGKLEKELKKQTGKGITLTYQGVDRVKWTLDLLEPVKNQFTSTKIPLGDDGSEDIVKYFEDITVLDSNVIFFPKIVNELNEKTRNALIEAATGKLNPKIDEYYFCFSHPKDKVEDKVTEQFKNSIAFVEQFIDAMNHNEEFDADGDFLYWDKKGREYFNSQKLEYRPRLTKQKYPYFHFEFKDKGIKISYKIRELNPDFYNMEADNEMKNIVKELNGYSKDRFRNRITTVDPIAYFQIIRLTKKK